MSSPVSQQTRQRRTQGWGAPSVRTLVNIGVFAAVYMAVFALATTIGAINPIVIVLGFILGVFLNGPVIMLLIARNPCMWVLTIFLGVIGLLMPYLDILYWFCPARYVLASWQIWLSKRVTTARESTTSLPTEYSICG